MESLAAGQEALVAYALLLRAQGPERPQALGLERAVNFGWFDFLGHPLLYV